MIFEAPPKLPATPESYGPMITPPEAAPSQSRYADLRCTVPPVNEENEWGLRPHTPSEANRLRELAKAVGEDLGRFGLAMYNREAPDWETAAGGLEIEVDTFDDAAGGIWLHWTLHPALRLAGHEAHRSGRPNDLVIQAAGHVHERMASAILSMLKALGYVAEDSDDDYRPFAIKVLSGPR